MNNPFCHRSDRDTKSRSVPQSNEVYLRTQERKERENRK